MWKHLKALQGTVWPRLAKQQLLEEMCRSLLSDGQWKLARSYLTGTGSTQIPPREGEVLVISAARNYFYSASTLDAPEIYLVHPPCPLPPPALSMSTDPHPMLQMKRQAPGHREEHPFASTGVQQKHVCQTECI